MKNKNFEIIIMLAWRNVWRNKRRTVLTLLTIIVGCAMIILLNAFAKGGHDQMIEDATSLVMGHIHIHEKGYWENRTIDYAFQADETIKKVLAGKNIRAHCQRIMCDALIAKGGITKGVMIQGVQPSREMQVCGLYKFIIKGRYLSDSDSTHAVIGDTLAQNLKVDINDTIAIISQGFDGSIAAEHLKIVGIFKSGNPEYDRFLLQMPLTQADETFSMMGYIHAIVIRALRVDDVDDIVAKLSVQLHTASLEVLGWEKLMPELVQFIIMDDVSGYLFDLMLFLVVAFGILNTIQMSVYERTRELGIMKAVGTTPGQVVALIMSETFFNTVIGVAAGVALGAGISYYFTVHPIDYSQFAEEIAVWGISTTIFPATVTIANIVVTAVLTMLVSLLFCIFPARRAARLHPVEAIRHI